MRTRSAVAATALAALLCLPLTGCGGGDGGADAAPPTATQTPTPSPAAEPRNAAEFLAHAREAMAARPGWTFTVRGDEGLTSPGGDSAASYTATVDRTTGEPMTLHSTGTTHVKGADKPEEVYVVDGTGHIRKGAHGVWTSGPVSDPGIAAVVEDPIAALDAFAEHGDAVTVRKSAGAVELRAALGSAAPLSAVRGRAVTEKAIREFAPTREQLRGAGIAPSDDRITVESVEETLTLDPTTYRLTAHRFTCVFLIPYQGGAMRYHQEVTEHTKGVFSGTVTLPAGVTGGS
ncbi:hypothetical protein [Streptomyces sp. bgisy154]|uniref:hypothetical protein n=1 Tax=Streptomyces sp. bgisy154 TaxID=3413794 RepID=UPI003D714EAD